MLATEQKLKAADGSYRERYERRAYCSKSCNSTYNSHEEVDTDNERLTSMQQTNEKAATGVYSR